MQRPTLIEVPNPLFPSIRDIALYTTSKTKGGPITICHLRGSSLKGQRSIADFFHILDHLITVENAYEYTLRNLDEMDFSVPIDRSFSGNITPGSYLIESAVASGEISFKPIPTFFDYPFERTDSSSKPASKRRRKRDGGESTASDKSRRDPTEDSQSFKMRLVYRDKGCVVCLAAGIQEKIYEYSEDSNRYEGGHIVGIAYQALWDSRGYSALVNDPYTDPANIGNPLASPSTRTGKDPRRINSLENGMLFCLEHHKDYDNFRISINCDTHQICSFHPATVKLQGIEVKAPWQHEHVLYPPPLPAFLEMHYWSSISKAMKGSGDDCELDDDDEDFEELSELKEIQNERVRIWLDGSLSGREITSSLDFTAENKGNIEMLTDSFSSIPFSHVH